MNKVKLESLLNQAFQHGLNNLESYNFEEWKDKVLKAVGK